jgi:potassium efflux system protein
VERPIRIGDAVTIGTISGTVARIHLRATTIMGWDNSELIVPNKALITGQLVNWTLSDLRVRLDVPVGVAYGSDIEKVKTTLMEVARRHPSVLDDPAPEVLFCEFGASSLKFELRVFINFPDGSPRVRDKLQVDIDREFRERNIVIAFPQLDVHVRSEPTLPPAERASPEVR